MAVVLASLGYWAEHHGRGYAGLSAVAVGLFVGALNAHLSFVRPWRFRRRHGSLEGYRFISGLPALGSFAVVWGSLWGFGELLTAVVGLVALVLDTGGLPWFLLETWRDRGFWDG